MAYNDGTDKVLAKTVINNVTITKLSNSGTKYFVGGVAVQEGTWCGTEKIPKDNSFWAEFENNGTSFNCKSVSTTRNITFIH